MDESESLSHSKWECKSLLSQRLIEQSQLVMFWGVLRIAALISN